MDQRDETRLRLISGEFANSVSEALSGWLVGIAVDRSVQGGVDPSGEVHERIVAVVRQLVADLEPRVRQAISADVDQPTGSPLAVLRDGIGPLNGLLSEIGAAPPRRDRVAVEIFPEDTYELGPAAFSDIDPSLQEAGITWGAARAHVHLQRRDGRGASPVESATVSDKPTFETVLTAVVDVEGWMTDDQARQLHDQASLLKSGEKMVEVGSFRGRSIIVVALAADEQVEVIAIDPHGGGDRGPQEISPDQARGDEDHAVFTANLSEAGVFDRVRHIRKLSSSALGDVGGDVALLYIDGAHRFGPARSDIVDWGNRVRPEGTMLIHDSFSSIGVTMALLTTTFGGGRWRYMGRNQSMAEYRRAELGPLDRVRNLLRQTLQLPWFLRNVTIKVLLTLRLKPLTRLLGHAGSDWPY